MGNLWFSSEDTNIPDSLEPITPRVPIEAANVNSKLNLSVTKSPNNLVLFDAVGLIYPNRKEGSGITYFITKTNNDQTTTDLFIPYFRKEEYTINKIHFAIRHNSENDKYYIIHYNDIEKGIPLYPIEVCFRVKENTKLNDRDIISFARTSILFSINKEEASDNSKITLHILQGDDKGKFFQINAMQTNPIMVGRKTPQQLVDVEINEDDVSRYQFTLIYQNKEWHLKDGDREGRYHSTNGTYLMISKKTEIVNGMEFVCKGHTFTAEIKL